MTRRVPLDPDLYADVVDEARSRFAVWPSAYASGWVVKTYKERGGRYAGEARGEDTGLTKWFGEEWVDLSRPIHDEDGDVVGYEPCGRKRSGDPVDYPKCRPAREAMRMTPAEVRDAIKRKRAAEAKAAKGRGGRGARAPVRVATYENPAPDTEAFRRWFGESKVVDENGQPLVIRRNPRAKVKPLTEREREDLPKANSFWMDFELENGPEWLPDALVDAEWPASPDDPELAREVLNLLYTRAPGDY